MSEKYQETFKTWNSVAKLYEDKFMDLELYNETYDIFCNSLNKTEASILEIGCGPGNITKYIKNKRPNFRITAVDVAENMIVLARKNNPNVDFRILDCRNISQLNNNFDAVICGFILPYLAKHDCLKLILDCNLLLKENGVFYLSFVAGANENSGYISGSSGERTYFYYHDLGWIKNELKMHSFNITHIIDLKYQRSDNTFETHTIVMAIKM